MKTPHRKLIALAVLSTLATSAFASELVLTTGDLTSEGYYIHSTPSGLNVINLDSPTKLQFSPTNGYSTFTAIYAEGDVVFQNDLNLTIDTKNVNETIGLCVDSSTVTTNALRIQVNANGEKDDEKAVSLMADTSTLTLEGQFELIAKQNGELGTALDAYNSTLSLTSSGNSKIEGNLDIFGGHAQITLQNSTDYWKGSSSGDLKFTLRNGAHWEPVAESDLDFWTWGKGGVLDVRNQDAEVRIESTETVIENGAILKIDLANNIIDSDASDLFISGISNTENVEVWVYAENSSNISLQNTDSYTVTLQGTGEMDSDTNPITDYVSLVGAESISENALYTLSSTPIIQQDGSAWIISGLRNEIKGSSTLMNQQLDFFGTNTIAHEQMTDRSVARALDRAILNQKHNGHWVDVTYSETDLHFNDGNRHQTLKTTGFEMGYDRQVTFPSLTDSVFTVSAQVAQSDVTIDRGDGEIDQWGFNVYAGGITENNYRVLLGGHYQQGKAELTSFAYLGNQKANFDFDREVWAASAYLGFVKSTFADSNWHIEPFMSGTAYWIKTDDSQNQGITIASEKLQQSVVRLGATVGYRSETIPVTWTAKGAWAHRFGRSVTMTGQTNNMTGEFATEDLKESWSELALEGRWDNQRGFSVSARAQMAKSHDVEPQFEVGLNAKFRF